MSVDALWLLFGIISKALWFCNMFLQTIECGYEMKEEMNQREAESTMWETIACKVRTFQCLDIIYLHLLQPSTQLCGSLPFNNLMFDISLPTEWFLFSFSGFFSNSYPPPRLLLLSPLLLVLILIAIWVMYEIFRSFFLVHLHNFFYKLDNTTIMYVV